MFGPYIAKVCSYKPVYWRERERERERARERSFAGWKGLLETNGNPSCQETRKRREVFCQPCRTGVARIQIHIEKPARWKDAFKPPQIKSQNNFCVTWYRHYNSQLCRPLGLLLQEHYVQYRLMAPAPKKSRTGDSRALLSDPTTVEPLTPSRSRVQLGGWHTTTRTARAPRNGIMLSPTALRSFNFAGVAYSVSRLCRKYLDKEGKPRYVGTRLLKKSECHPELLGFGVCWCCSELHVKNRHCLHHVFLVLLQLFL